MRQVISKDDKAVSPIIATILLIAITVVLAATLVTILGGFTKGASSSSATASATTQFTNNNGSNNVYVNVSAFSATSISSAKIGITLTVNGGTPVTGTLAAGSAIGSYTISSTSSSQFTGGSVYEITGLPSSVTSVTVQLTYGGSVIYTS